jgi:hypothetical protein
MIAARSAALGSFQSGSARAQHEDAVEPFLLLDLIGIDREVILARRGRRSRTFDRSMALRAAWPTIPDREPHWRSSFLRRLLAGKIAGDGIASALGKLQILQKRGEQLQSLQVLTISRLPSGPTGLFKTLRVMTRAARSMIKPKRGNVA